MKSTVEHYLATKILDRGVYSKDKIYVLNGGGQSSYYYKFNEFSNSSGLVELGFSYYTAIKDFNLDFDVLVGVPYKGVIVVLATAFYSFCFPPVEKEKNIKWAFLRKELKVRGEGGYIIGSDVTGKKVLLLDDVLTSGAALSQALAALELSNPLSVSCLVGVDRNEQLRKLPYGNGFVPVYGITRHSYVEDLYQKRL